MDERNDGEEMSMQYYQSKLQQAGEFGKMLLDENEDLKSQIDDLRKDFEKKIEATEQECHSLQVKLDQKNSLQNWYNEEITHLKQQLADRQEHLRETWETEKHQELAKLHRQIEELKGDLEQQTGLESQLKQKVRELEDLVKERLKTTDDPGSRSFGLSEEVTVLQEEVANLQTEITSLQSQLIDKRSELGAMATEVENLRGKVMCRDEELEDVKCQFTSVNNALEHARMEKLDLKCQLDALQMEASSHRSKGNSIFAELDDRRVDAETKLISLQRKNETLTEKYLAEKQQNSRYKRQISQLLLTSNSGKFDDDYVNNLECKLSQARQEIRTLLEEKEVWQKKADSQPIADPPETKLTDGEYTRYLKTILLGKEQEVQELSKEVNRKSLQLLDVRSLMSEKEARVVTLQAEKDRLRSQSMKLLAQNQELRLKYEPDSIKKSEALIVKRTEKIPLNNEEEVVVKETRRSLNVTSLNQSQMSFQRPSERIVQSETTLQPIQENVPEKSLIALSKPKLKHVSISDDVKEYEIESENKPNLDSSKQMGKTLTVRKHISAPKGQTQDCKTQ